MTVKGLVVAVTIVPVPGVKPARPYSIFQLLSFPPGVHDRVTEAEVVAVELRCNGIGQEEVRSKVMSSTYKYM